VDISKLTISLVSKEKTTSQTAYGITWTR